MCQTPSVMCQLGLKSAERMSLFLSYEPDSEKMYETVKLYVFQVIHSVYPRIEHIEPTHEANQSVWITLKTQKTLLC